MESKMYVTDVLKMTPEKVTNELLKKNFKNLEFDDGTYYVEAHELQTGTVNTVRNLNSIEVQVMLISASNALFKLFKERKLDKVMYFSVFRAVEDDTEHTSDFIPHIISFSRWVKSTAAERMVDTAKVNSALGFLGLPLSEIESLTANAIKNREQSIYRTKIGMDKSDTSSEEVDEIVDEDVNSVDTSTFFQV